MDRKLVMPNRLARRAAVLTSLVAVLSGLPGLSQADVDCGLDRIRLGFRQMAASQPAESQWVTYRRIDSPGPKAVGKDQTIFAAEFSRQVQAGAMRVPTNFSFRSGWILNTQFSFQENQALRIQSRYDLPGGETIYALEVPEKPQLTLFSRADGVLCNKVMNSNAGDHVFLLRTYKSSPATKLRMASTTESESPLVLKVIYLGSSGGIASFRSIWSKQGRILQSEDHRYDLGASRLQIAAIDLPIVRIASNEVVVGEVTLSGPIAWSAYWSRLFGRNE